MNNKDENNKYSNIIIIVIIAIVILLAIYLLFFRPMTNAEDNTTDQTNSISHNLTNSNGDIKDEIEIADANTKELYERVKNGITLNGKLIEVPKTYMDKITKKVTAEGYKITDDTKKTISSKLDEIESIIKNEGKDDINDLSNDSKEKIKEIYNEIDKML